MTDLTENLNKDIKSIKSSMEIIQFDSGTFIVAVACDRNSNNNRILEISASKGVPLTHETYNQVRETYHVIGVDYHDMGFITVNYRISLIDLDWISDIPLPFSVIKRHLAEQQFEAYLKWASKFTVPDFYVKYLQIRNVFRKNDD